MCYVENKAFTSPDGQHGWQETTFPCHIVQSGGRCPSMMSPKIQPPDSWLNPQRYPQLPMERGRSMQKPRNTRPLLRQSEVYPRRGLPERNERATPYHGALDGYEVGVPRRRGSIVGLNNRDTSPSEWHSGRRNAVTSYHLGRRPSVTLPARRRRGSTSPYPQRSAYGETTPRRSRYIDSSQPVPVALIPNSSYRPLRHRPQRSDSREGYEEFPANPFLPRPPHNTASGPLMEVASFNKKNSGKIFSKLPSRMLADYCGWQVGKEKFLWKNEPVMSIIAPTARGFLGRGTVGLVDEVKIVGYDRCIARKRIILARSKSSALRDRNDIRAEIENLRRLDHEHIIKILGCYEEQFGRVQSICALMYPAGDEDLGHFLYEECHPVTVLQKRWIKTWFRCLASALAYMHEQKVHHEDIKPSNIIHRGKDIFFTDFSSSRRLEAGQDTSTESPAKATRLFAAPEAMMSEDGKMMKHGSKTDVYSLGLVYVEMAAVLSGQSITEMRDHIFQGFQPIRQYHRVIDKIPEYLGQDYAEAWNHCLKHMLYPTRPSRPSAQEVTVMLDKARGLKPSKASCTCYKNQQASGAGKASRRSMVAVHNPPSTKQDPKLTPEMPASSEISVVVRFGKVLITEKRGSSDNPNDEATLTGDASTRPATPFKATIASVTDDSIDDDQKSLQSNKDHSLKEFDDEFVWIHKGQVAVESLEDALRPADVDDESTIANDGKDNRSPASLDIHTVMQNTKATWQEAIQALNEHDSDVVNAVMALSN